MSRTQGGPKEYAKWLAPDGSDKDTEPMTAAFKDGMLKSCSELIQFCLVSLFLPLYLRRVLTLT